MRTHSLLLPLGAGLLPLLASAQMGTQAGTSLEVDQGTSLRIEAPLTWTISSGASVINNGNIVLGPQTELAEAPGAAITGTGTERTTRELNGPLVNVDPGGLGGIITTDVSLGTTSVERGHVPRTDYSGHASIARWIDITPTNNSGLNADLALRYDVNELNGLQETAQVMHIATINDIWWFLGSTVNTGQRTVTVGGLDSLGTFTTFDQDLPNALSKGMVIDGFRLYGNAGNEPALAVPQGRSVGRIDILNSVGAVVRTGQANWGEGLHALDLPDLAPGFYHLRINGAAVLDLVKP